MDIKGLVVVVTGGAGNFGQGIVKSLEAKGAIVVILDLQGVDKENYYQVDLCQEQQVVDTIDSIMEKYNRIDVLINNAGIIYSEPLINIMNPKQMRHSYATFDKYLRVNLDSTFIISAVVAEKMVKKRIKGLLINMSSISAGGNAGQSAYAAAKAGVIALTKTWSKELGAFGIRSVAIAPGFIDTPSTATALNEGIIKHIITNTPLKKMGKVDDISSTILYAIENDFLNGTVLNVDGGLTI
jgi:3-oxoacyl-[acyl-carrier protein] reductase